MKMRDVLLALLVVVILGANFVAVKVGVTQAPPIFLTGLRFFFAAFPAVFFVKAPRVPLRILLAFGFVAGIVQFSFLFTAVRLGMSAGLSSLIIQMQVFFTAAVAALVFKELPSLLQVIGASVGAAGITVIGVFGGEEAKPLPLLLVLAAAFAWAVANVLTKAAGRVNPLSFIVWSSLVAPIPLFLASWLFEAEDAVRHVLLHPTWTLAACVAFLAYPTTLVAFPLWTGLLGRYPAAKIVPFGFLIPVTGILSTHVLLSEQIGTASIVGSAIVLLGLGLNLAGSQRAAGVAKKPLASDGS